MNIKDALGLIPVFLISFGIGLLLVSVWANIPEPTKCEAQP